jgi:hypothetical protein
VQSEKEIRESVSRLLTSLAFPEMNARYNSISPSHQSTFEWLFDSLDGSTDGSSEDFHFKQNQQRIEKSRQDFSNWLSSEEKLFWINGKPGSGKSTLMKFIREHPSMHALLPEQNESALILSHFIWNAGSSSQRSQRGLVASLLHQALSHRDDVGCMFIQEKTLQHKMSHSDWSLEELERYLFEALRSAQSPVLIFLDGLDEIDHDQGEGLYNLLELVNRLESLPRVKMCISSRPEILVVSRLQIRPNMKLQDLTYRDMRTYTLETLETYWQEASFLHPPDKMSIPWPHLSLRRRTVSFSGFA